MNKNFTLWSIVLALILFSSISFAACTGSQPPAGAWTIDQDTNCSDMTIYLNGDMALEAGNTLNFTNVTFLVNHTSDGSYDIDIYGNFTVSSSNITSANTSNEYRFRIRSGSTFAIYDSHISEAGWRSGGSNEDRGSLWINTDNTLIQNTSIINDYRGIVYYSSSNNNVTNSIISAASSYGIYIYTESSSNSFSNNNISSPSETGIYIRNYGVNNNFTGNIITAGTTNSDYGIYIRDQCNNTIVDNNNITSYDHAIYIETSYSNTIINNRINSTNDYGTYVFDSSHNNNITNNIINSNSQAIRLDRANNTKIISNTLTSSDNTGLYIVSSYNTIIEHNTITGTSDGVYISSNYNTLFNNTITGSSGDGLDLNSVLGSNITSNTISTTNNRGIYLHDRSNNSIFINNTIITDNEAGVYLEESSNNNVFDNNNITAGSTGNDFGVRIRTNSHSNNFTNNEIHSRGDDGINLNTAHNNIFTNNNITSGTGNGDIGIYLTGSSNNTFNNNNVTAADYGTQLASNSLNNTFTSNIIVTSGSDEDDGLFVDNSHNNTFTNNNITSGSGSGDYGVFLDDSINNTFTNNNITGIGDDGLYLRRSNHSTFSNNTITSSGDDGVYMKTSYNNIFIGNTISTTATGSDRNSVYSRGSINNRFIDCNISASEDENIYFRDTGNLTLINTTFDRSKPSNYHGSASASELIVKWYLDVNITSSQGNPNNATISVYDVTSILLFSNITNSSGNIFRKNITEFINIGGSATYYTNHTINVTKAGYASNSTSVNMSTSRLVILNIDDIYGPVISLVIYQLNSTDDLDPYANITFNATVTDTNNVSLVMLQYHNGTGWNNATMTNHSANNYNVTITLISTETNYTFKIWSNDTFDNSKNNTNQSFQSYWDCTWIAESDLGQTGGWDQNKWIGNITINNTGDPQHANNSCTLDFRLTYDLTEGRIYLDNIYYKPTDIYTISAKANQTITVNATFLSEVMEENVIITINEVASRSDNSSKNVTATLVTTRDNPYLYQVIESAPSSLYLTIQNFSLSAYLRNIVGDGTSNYTAYNVSFNWSLPSDFLVKDGNISLSYDNISDSLANYNNLNISFNSSNLPDMSPGTYTLTIYSLGYNRSSDLIRHVNNETLLTASSTISLNCYNESDNICVNACGYLLDSDCTTTTTTTQPSSDGGTGGGGYGTGALVEAALSEESVTSSEVISLVRGYSGTFPVSVKNIFKGATLYNVSIKIDGYLSQYMIFSPTRIDKINYDETKEFTVTVASPTYMEKGEQELTIIITGDIKGAGINKALVETRTITLAIHTVSEVDVNKSIKEAKTAIQEMETSGFPTTKIEKTLAKAEQALTNHKYDDARLLVDDIIQTKETAFIAYNAIQGISNRITRYSSITGEFLGVQKNFPQTQEIINLATAAFEREDYETALQRVQGAEMTLALESSEFSLFFFIVDYWWVILISLALVAVVFILGYKIYTEITISQKIKELEKEEATIRKLMKDVQRHYYKGKVLGVGTYHSTMLQHQRRLSRIKKLRNKLRHKRVRLMKPAKLIKDLEEEKKELNKILNKLQKDYFKDDKISKTTYTEELKSYNERLAEIENEHLTLETKLLQHGEKK